MPKVKVPRKSTIVDMTAMCDVSFLLLTFFILTAKFRPDQSVVIDMPSSRSNIKVEDAIFVSVDKEGKAYLSTNSTSMRYETLQNMIEKYGDRYPNLKTLTEEQKKTFSLIDMLGTPIEDLPRVLSMTGPQYNEYKKKLPGIPIDSAHNQLGDWVMAARYANPKMRIAIKGDKFTNIRAVQRIIEIFREKDIYRFNLITNLSKGGEEQADKKEE
ncbi:MAG: biopolymer transporter ExbD [Chitinophagales bacterium]|nr:biopolymer transporter ExbD [Chitinophagales bacterium]